MGLARGVHPFKIVLASGVLVCYHLQYRWVTTQPATARCLASGKSKLPVHPPLHWLVAGE